MSVFAALLSTVMVLISVAYYVVLERKLLSIMQRRKGPNKAGLVGMVLPLADGFKGVTKEVLVPSVSSKEMFMLAPALLFSISYFVWSIYPVPTLFSLAPYTIMCFFCAVSLNVFGVIACGWNSGSQYGLIGGMRAGAQTVSYEIVYNSLVVVLITMLSKVEVYDFRFNSFIFFMVVLEVMMMWVVASLAELNRAPFDFVEGESELVSGYMVEYGGMGFILIILGEYGSIVFSGLMGSCLFFGGLGFNHVSSLAFVVLMVIMSLTYVYIRGTVPRYRYDKLMVFCWTCLLPLVSGLIMLYLCLSAYKLYFMKNS